jgi:adenosylhomocysteine nucleosidase
VIDALDRDLPPAAIIELRDDGTPDVLAVSRAVIRQPNQIPALVRTAMDAWTARKALRFGRCRLGMGLCCPYFNEPASALAGADAFGATRLRSAGS